MLVFLQQNPNACVHLCISLYPLPLVPKQWTQTRMLLACFYSTHHLLQDCCLCSDENASIFLPFFFYFRMEGRNSWPSPFSSILNTLVLHKKWNKKVRLVESFWLLHGSVAGHVHTFYSVCTKRSTQSLHTAPAHPQQTQQVLDTQQWP